MWGTLLLGGFVFLLHLLAPRGAGGEKLQAIKCDLKVPVGQAWAAATAVGEGGQTGDQKMQEYWQSELSIEQAVYMPWRML